jgi:hypothetical protein
MFNQLLNDRVPATAELMSFPSLDCTGTKLRQLARVVAHYYDRELGKVGLGTTQYWLLTEVLSHGPIRPCDLAHAMSLSPSTLTQRVTHHRRSQEVRRGPPSLDQRAGQSASVARKPNCEGGARAP